MKNELIIRTTRWNRLGYGRPDFAELGAGTALLDKLYTAIGERTALTMLELAWSPDLRYFDTAPLYSLGLSEARFNRMLRGRPRACGGPPTKPARTACVQRR